MLTLLKRDPIIHDDDYVPFKRFQLGGCYGNGPFGSVRVLEEIISEQINNEKNNNVSKKNGTMDSEKQILSRKRTLMEKHLKKEYSGFSEFKKNFNEAANIKHENIIKYLGWTYKDDYYGIILEFMEGGTLHDLIHNKKAKYKFKKSLSWSIQAAKAIRYMHQRNIVHGAIIPQNMLLNGDFHTLKLCKFEQYEGPTKKNSCVSKLGIKIYYPLEVLKDQKLIESSLDVYSWALSFWECYIRKYPHNECETEEELLEKLSDPNYLLQMIPRVPKGINKIIQDCSRKNPLLRPSMETTVDMLTVFQDTISDENINYEIDLDVDDNDHKKTEDSQSVAGNEIAHTKDKYVDAVDNESGSEKESNSGSEDDNDSDKDGDKDDAFW